jgi:hypothetical protein
MEGIQMYIFKTVGIGKIITIALIVALGHSHLISLAHDVSPNAAPYSGRDKVYLNQIVPIITELSEVGKAVSASAVGLQSKPSEECANENGFFQGVVGGLRSNLGAITPPQRMKPVHVKALDGFTEYMTGLTLYISACTDKETTMRTKLFNQGTQYIINADITIQAVNDMIANPAHIPARAAAGDQIKEWCGSRWAADYKMQEHCIKAQTESRAELGELLERNPRGTPGNDAILDCTATWTDPTGAYNYKMILFCAKNKIR